jgi:hypothetical protein
VPKNAKKNLLCFVIIFNVKVTEANGREPHVDKVSVSKPHVGNL